MFTQRAIGDNLLDPEQVRYFSEEIQKIAFTMPAGPGAMRALPKAGEKFVAKGAREAATSGSSAASTMISKAVSPAALVPPPRIAS